jgi:antirestriction protein
MNNEENERRADVPRPEGPRIYVASLADYNAGRLHGEWITLDEDRDALWAHVQSMLASSPEPIAEEWAIHDFEGFGPLALDEYENLDAVHRIAAGIAEHGEAFAHWASLLDRNEWSEELDAFIDHYLGSWSSMEEFVEQMLDDMGIDTDEIGPEFLQPYIHVDIEALARDVAMDYRVSEGREGVHVFDW